MIRHGAGGQAGKPHGLGRRLGHLGLIVQRADHAQAEPGPGRAQAAGEGDHAQKDAHAGQNGEGGAGRDDALHPRHVHADGLAGTVGPHGEHDAHKRHEGHDAGADEIDHRAVEPGKNVHDIAPFC